MLLVIWLLHLNCLPHYGLCGLNLGYKRFERPVFGVAICISVAIATPAIVGFYTILSPLGKEYAYGPVEEAQIPITAGTDNSSVLRSNSLENKLSFCVERKQRFLWIN